MKCFILWETDHVAEDFSFEKSIEVHFNRSKIILLYFYDAYDVSLWEKKVRRKYGEQMQNIYTYRISSFYEKRVETAED